MKFYDHYCLNLHRIITFDMNFNIVLLYLVLFHDCLIVIETTIYHFYAIFIGFMMGKTFSMGHKHFYDTFESYVAGQSCIITFIQYNKS